jgi:predicted RNA-binding protein
MCESTVYLKDGAAEKVLMKEVASVRPRGGKLVLTSILGEHLEVDAVVTELDLMGHRIVVERGADRSRGR